MLLTQQNARSLLANGHEFKGYSDKLEQKLDIIWIQETWIKRNLDFIIKGYNTIREDGRNGMNEDVQQLLKKVQYIGDQIQYKNQR